MLGAQVMPNGHPSRMLEDRIAAAAELYEAGKVDKLLLSGDHSRVVYDEVGTMRNELLKRGIPAEDIFTDHAGFDTWDSAQRAKRVFDVRLRRRRHPAIPHGPRALRRPSRRAEGHRLRGRPGRARVRPGDGAPAASARPRRA